jgi:hypothetical protein
MNWFSLRENHGDLASGKIPDCASPISPVHTARSRREAARLPHVDGQVGYDPICMREQHDVAGIFDGDGDDRRGRFQFDLLQQRVVTSACLSPALIPGA